MQRCSLGGLLSGGPHPTITAPQPSRHHQCSTRLCQVGTVAAAGITSTSGCTSGRSEWHATTPQACLACLPRTDGGHSSSWDSCLTIQRNKSAHESHLDAADEQFGCPQVLDNIVRFLKDGHSGPAGTAALRLVERVSEYVGHEQQSKQAGRTLAVASAMLLPCLLLRTMQMADVEHMLCTQLALVLHDSLLVLRAANEASMDARSFVDWCLQSCSTQAALAAILFCNATSRLPRAHSNLHALAARLGLPWHMQPACLQLAECHASSTLLASIPLLVPAQHGALLSTTARSTHASLHRVRCSAAPPGAAAAPATVQLSNDSVFDDAPGRPGRSMEGPGEAYYAASGQFMSATNSEPSSSGSSSSSSQPAQQQAPWQQPEASFSSESKGPTQPPVVPPGPEPASQKEGGEQESWLSGVRQRRQGSRLLARPQRTMQSDDDDAHHEADDTHHANGPRLGSRPVPREYEYEPAKPRGVLYPSDDEEYGVVDEYGVLRRAGRRAKPQLQLPPQPPKHTRVARAVPMHLVPISDAYPLLDPETLEPLEPQGPGEQKQGSKNSQPGTAALPLIGPFVVSNCTRAFPATDALLDYTAGNQTIRDRLCMRLEYVVQREGVEEQRFVQELTSQQQSQQSEGLQNTQPQQQQQPAAGGMLGDWESEPEVLTANLQLYNISRRVRGRTADCAMRVRRPSGQELSILPGDPGVRLQPGDVILFGAGPFAPGFRVVVPAGGAHSSSSSSADFIDRVVARHCAAEAAAVTAAAAAAQAAAAQAGPSKRQKQMGPRSTVGNTANLAHFTNLGLAQVNKLARTNPQAGYTAYCYMLAGKFKGNPFVWSAAAQLAASMGRLRVARDMFRAAVAAATLSSSSSSGVAGSSQHQVDGMGQAAQQAQLRVAQQQQAPDAAGAGAGAGTISGARLVSQPQTINNAAQAPQQATQPSSTSSASQPATPSTSAPLSSSQPSSSPPSAPPQSFPTRTGLATSLMHWACFEWAHAKLQGSSRHLWRAAADAAMTHPAGPSAGGVGVVLHTWASAELARGNVMNARVVVAEALRKCPQEQPLYVLAASVELAGADYELARAFCLRAYEMERTDKHLYTVWPLVMAAMGEKDKARVLFERGMDYHPQNTKIMLAYAVFEAEKGDVEAARELHARALSIDPLSLTTMSNRVAWARLESDQGRLDTAYSLLHEGLAAHPLHVPALIELARTERLAGELSRAQAVLRDAARLTHAFDVNLIRERASLMRDLGERALAAALDAHLRAVMEMEAAKKLGARTSDAWAAYVAASSSPERRKLASEAHLRKQQLGFADARRGVVGPRAVTRANPNAWRPIPARGPVRPVTGMAQYGVRPREEGGEQGAAGNEAGGAAAGVAAAGAAAAAGEAVHGLGGAGAGVVAQAGGVGAESSPSGGPKAAHAAHINGHAHSYGEESTLQQEGVEERLLNGHREAGQGAHEEAHRGSHEAEGEEEEEEGGAGRPLLARSRPQDARYKGGQ